MVVGLMLGAFPAIGFVLTYIVTGSWKMPS
jgi:hypothetical protein